MSKRGRIHNNRKGHAPRPIDKQIKGVVQTCTTSQTSTSLMDVTFPCTVVGIRWDFAFRNVVASAPDVRWAIIVVRDGNSPNTLGGGDGADLYTPEQDVFAWGYWHAADGDAGGGPETVNITGHTKSMRKLMGGDSLMMIAKCSVVNGMSLIGAVQFFCKT